VQYCRESSVVRRNSATRGALRAELYGKFRALEAQRYRSDAGTAKKNPTLAAYCATDTLPIRVFKRFYHKYEISRKLSRRLPEFVCVNIYFSTY
jgi:hypothetical protein